MRVWRLVAVAVAVMCSLVVVLSSGLASAGRKRQANPVCEIVSAPVFRPRLLLTAPPVALTSILEVLQRPRSSAAELPPGGVPGLGYSVLWVNYVHLLATGPDRTRYFLIPGIRDVQLSAACLHSLSPSERHEYETQLHTGSVTLEAVKDEERAGAIPYTAQAIEAGRALLAIPGQSNSTTTISGVVPDGVASVTITAANGATATAPVTNNLFLAELPASELKPLTVKWYAAGGSLIKTARIEHVPGSALPAIGSPTLITVSPPPAVVHAGGRQLAEFEQGRMVTAQSGCLACHRIGQTGNHGPGPNLTHIGSKLSGHSIEHALIDPTAPMPSFKNLPPAKFKAVVEFLSELR
ncbi:MAG: c-type cytochrome [Solirubrobacterales bacterium]